MPLSSIECNRVSGACRLIINYIKLKSHGMGNSIINWMADRKQRVVVDGEVSSWKSVLSGVPQRICTRAYFNFIFGIHRCFRGRYRPNRQHIDVCK